MDNNENVSRLEILEEKIEWVYSRLSILLVFVMILQVTVVADYGRAKLCTNATYGTIIRVESNKLFDKTYSYNYVIRADIGNIEKTIEMKNVTDVYYVGDSIYIMYSKKHGIYRTPNIFY